MLRQNTQKDHVRAPLVKRTEIPMRDLADVLDWHATQVERFQRLADSRDVSGFRYERQKRKADLSQMEFHQRIVTVLERELAKQ